MTKIDIFKSQNRIPTRHNKQIKNNAQIILKSREKGRNLTRLCIYVFYIQVLSYSKNEHTKKKWVRSDDTLIDFVPAFLKFYNEEYRTNHEKREFHNYRFWEILGGTRERMMQIVHAFHETNFAKSVTAIDGAREMIQHLHND